MTNKAMNAALTARISRLRKLYEAWQAYRHDLQLAQSRMPADIIYVTRYNVKDCRMALEACLAHLDEIERHMDDNQGPSASEEWSIDPDVAL